METVRARTIFSDQRVTVTVVESLELRAEGWNHARFLLGSLKPIAIVVKEPGRTYALDLAAQPVDIEGMDLPADSNLE